MKKLPQNGNPIAPDLKVTLIAWVGFTSDKRASFYSGCDRQEYLGSILGLSFYRDWGSDEHTICVRFDRPIGGMPQGRYCQCEIKHHFLTPENVGFLARAIWAGNFAYWVPPLATHAERLPAIATHFSAARLP